MYVCIHIYVHIHISSYQLRVIKINKTRTFYAVEDMSKEQHSFIADETEKWYCHYRNNVDITQKLTKQGLGYRSGMPATLV